jgi:hypothetical protein
LDRCRCQYNTKPAPLQHSARFAPWGNLTFGFSTGIVGTVSTDSSRPLGEWLRQRREELDISLEQAEADTRIRLSYLEALESEDFDALPDPVVGRGFVRNYATYLDLDPKEAADRFSELVAPPEPESHSVEGPTPFTSEPFRPAYWPGGSILASPTG